LASDRQVSPTKLAATLGAGLLALVVLLSLLAPRQTPIDLSHLESFVADDRVSAIDVSGVGVVGHLREPVMLEVGGQRHRAVEVVVPGRADSAMQEALLRWQSAGLTVVTIPSPEGHRLQETAWIGFVSLLLLFGMYHLVMQARRHRRDGSPRQHLDHARADLAAGRISAEEFERRATAISIEM